MKLWAGRFEKATDKRVDAFGASIPFDKRLYKEDIEGSRAHAAMLVKQGVLTTEDGEAIEQGLLAVLADIESGNVDFSVEYEDIHMLVETLLTEKIGGAGKRLHTGRSRNDQVALDMRLYARKTCESTLALLYSLCDTLLTLVQARVNDVMPGYTHLQRAQPITVGHWLSAYFQMFLRDMKRFKSAYEAADVMPLGSGALAGTSYPLDRAFVAERLGFSAITMNSLDGVSDRDFLLDYLSAAANCMLHLSRFCEELILYSSTEFGFVTMDDGYSTGSSMMPQKKNPDVAELIRGKTGRVYGDLTALLTLMKGLPLAYNKDMQEDKEAFFDASDTLQNCLSVFIPMLQTLSFNTARMRGCALEGFTNATDCADYLVGKGVPFRDAHAAAGALVHECVKRGCGLTDLSLDDMRAVCNAFDQDVYAALSLDTCVSVRNVPGGPNPQRVLDAIAAGREALKKVSE